jgi:hypothetical protein
MTTRQIPRGPDRRTTSRGGRRTDDREGFAPLVLLVGEKPGVVEQSEAVLAKLHFAVTTSSNVEEALRVVAELRPDLVVSNAPDAARIRTEVPEHLPVVVVDEGMKASAEVLIEEIRRVIRSTKPLAL